MENLGFFEDFPEGYVTPLWSQSRLVDVKNKSKGGTNHV